MKKVELNNNHLVFGDFAIQFQRTLRVPDTHETYNLPSGLGHFPVRRVEDYADNPHLPEQWRQIGGVFIPMYLQEAMWISFEHQGKPHAVQVGFGKVNAVSGNPWTDHLVEAGYMVAPPQRWLDGINVGASVVRQIIAVEFGSGQSVESQVSKKEQWGGLQIGVIPPKDSYQFTQTQDARFSHGAGMFFAGASLNESLDGGGVTLDSAHEFTSATRSAVSKGVSASRAADRGIQKQSVMSIGAGGKIDQKIYPDPYGINTWDQSKTQRVFVHIASPALWRAITGEAAPSSPITADVYKRYGYTWHAVYDAQMGDIEASDALSSVKSVKQKMEDDGNAAGHLGGSISDHPTVGHTVTIPTVKTLPIKDGDW